MITASTYGAPNWVDLSTPDVEASAIFYDGLLGWRVEKTTTPMGDYYIGFAGGQQVAGMMEQSSHMGDMAMWTVFINVEDIDATTEMAQHAGGSVLQGPTPIPDGKVAVVADPAGAMFGLIAGPAPEGTWLSQEPGAVSWIETLTRDTAASEGFYTMAFDWKAETQDYRGTAYTTFSLDSEPVAGMMMMPDTVPAEVPAHWAVYFTVSDCEMAVKRLIELGGNAVAPVMDSDMGRFAVVEDQYGAVFQLMDYIK